MKIQFHILGLHLNAGLRHWLVQPIERLQNLISVTAAAVVLEQRRDNAPAFRVFVSLAVPGPDIHAEARDHTLEAAWLKVAKALRQQIERRRARQQLRHKGQRQHPLTGSRWCGAPVLGRV
jgi:ribosome-associated translation inhibitor RaiA